MIYEKVANQIDIKIENFDGYWIDGSQLTIETSDTQIINLLTDVDKDTRIIVQTLFHDAEIEQSEYIAVYGATTKSISITTTNGIDFKAVINKF